MEEGNAEKYGGQDSCGTVAPPCRNTVHQGNGSGAHHGCQQSSNDEDRAGFREELVLEILYAIKSTRSAAHEKVETVNKGHHVEMQAGIAKKMRIEIACPDGQSSMHKHGLVRPSECVWQSEIDAPNPESERAQQD